MSTSRDELVALADYLEGGRVFLSDPAMIHNYTRWIELARLAATPKAGVELTRHVSGSLLPSNEARILQPVETPFGTMQVRVIAELDTHGLFHNGSLLATHGNGYSCYVLLEKMAARDADGVTRQAQHILECGGTTRNLHHIRSVFHAGSEQTKSADCGNSKEQPGQTLSRASQEIVAALRNPGPKVREFGEYLEKIAKHIEGLSEDVSVLDGIRDALEARGYCHMVNGRDIGKLLDANEQSAQGLSRATGG